LLLAFVACVYSLTQDQYNAIVSDVRKYLEPPATDYVNQADFFGGVVRLPFHDAGSYDQADGTGKPSACVNPADPGNGGLTEVINGIEPVYQMHKTELSRADYWVVVAHVAIQDAGGPAIPMSWGRIDCEGNYPPMGRLPDAEKNWTEVYNVFVKRMGLTIQDITALLGAHTLGRAMPENSGYAFYWTPTANKFTNQFYKDLLYGSWSRYTNSYAFHGDTHEWNTDPLPTGADPQMMLNTDMSLVYLNIGSGGDGTCANTSNTACTTNPDTQPIVQKYAANQTLWFQDFTNAWIKMTSLGWKLEPLVA